MPDDTAPQGGRLSKTVLKTMSKYLARLRAGERIMRDANGRLQWASGKPLGERTVRHMLNEGVIAPLDTDLFGDPTRGQTIGLIACKDY